MTGTTNPGQQTQHQQMEQQPNIQPYPRPGLQQPYSPQQLLLQQPMQHTQSEAQAPLQHPASLTPSPQMTIEMIRQNMYRQVDALCNNSAALAQFGLPDQSSVPIERSQSDMGPQTSSHSFGSIQSTASDNGHRPGTSRSMCNIRQESGWDFRPYTPVNQMSASPNAQSPFTPLTPPHQVTSEALNLTHSNAPTPHAPLQPISENNYGMDITADFTFTAPQSTHTSNRNSVDLSATQSPSKALGSRFSRLNVDTAFQQDFDMHDILADRPSTPEGASPGASSSAGSDDESKYCMKVDTGVSDEWLRTWLREIENPTAKQKKFLCIYEPDECEKYFNRPENARNHIQAHIKDKPHHCIFPDCNKRFTRPHDCKRHARTHTQQDRYKCECGFHNSRKDAYDRHLARVSCDPQKAKHPDRVKEPTKRGRPRKPKTPSPVKKDRVTKATSPRKKADPRKENSKRAAAITQAVFPPSPSPTHRSLPNDKAGTPTRFVEALQFPVSLPVAEAHPMSPTSPSYAPIEPASPSYAPAQSLFNPTPQSYGPVSPYASVEQLQELDLFFPQGASLATPPGSPPDLSDSHNSPIASSMGEELPSAAYGGEFDSNGGWAQLFPEQKFGDGFMEDAQME